MNERERERENLLSSVSCLSFFLSIVFFFRYLFFSWACENKKKQLVLFILSSVLVVGKGGVREEETRVEFFFFVQKKNTLQEIGSSFARRRRGRRNKKALTLFLFSLFGSLTRASASRPWRDCSRCARKEKDRRLGLTDGFGGGGDGRFDADCSFFLAFSCARSSIDLPCASSHA